jgi:cytochrome c2
MAEVLWVRWLGLATLACMSESRILAGRTLLLLLTAAGGQTAGYCQKSVVPGLYGEHGLDQVSVGRVLMEELHCGACHQSLHQGTRPRQPGPDLTRVGARVDPDYLRRFLARPAAAQPGSKMPDLLGAYSDEQRRSVAEALTHFSPP